MKKVFSLFMVALLSLALVACVGNAEDKAALQEASDALLIDTLVEDPQAVVSGFTVPTSLRNNVTATWTTSDNVYAALKDKGVEGELSVIVDRPIVADKTIKLTAALQLNQEKATKELTFTIPKLPEGTVEFDNIADLRTAAKASDGWAAGQSNTGLVPSFKLADVTVVNLDADAYHVVDEEGDVLMVFGTPTVNVGDKGTLIGQIDSYYWSLQATNTTLVLQEENVVATPENVNLSIYDFKTKTTADELKNAKTDPTYIKYMKFDAYVVLRSDFTGGANYQMTLIDPTSGADFDSGFVLSYYKGAQHEALAGFVGKVVTATATVRELRDSRATTEGNAQPVWSLSIATVTEKGAMPAETLVAVDVKGISITTDFPAETSGTYTLPAVGADFNSAFVWSVVSGGNVAAISGSTLTLTPVAGQRNEATIKVVGTLETKTAEREFVIFVGDYVDKSIADVLGADVASNSVIRVEGVITYVENTTYGNVFITDANGKSIYARGNFGGQVPGANVLKVGNKVQAVGAKSVYNGLVQLNTTLLVVVAENQEVPAPAAITTLAEAIANISGMVTLTGVVSDLANNESTSSNTTFKVTIGDDVFAVRVSSRDVNIAGLTNGANVTITSIVDYYESGYEGGDVQGSNAASIQIKVYAAASVVINA